MPFDPSSLPAEAQAYVAGLEKALVESGKAAPVAPTVQPSEADVMAKAIADLPEGLREVMAKSQRDAAEAQSLAKSLIAEREQGEYMAKAIALTHVPGVTPAFGEVMRKAAHGDQDALSQVFKALETSNSALREGNLFKEIGSAAPAAGSAHEEMEALAKSFEEKDPSLSHAEAIAKAAGSNGELYGRYSREMNRRNKGLED